jgi:predicted dehydrogenase
MTPYRIRVGIAGLAHWHLDRYLEVIKRDGRAAIVGLSNGDERHGRALAGVHGCDFYGDVDEMCARSHPDVVLVLGLHSEMPDLARVVISRKIPLVLEKPGGTTGSVVASLKRLADEVGAFVSVPFVHRLGPLCEYVAQSREPVLHCSFRFVTGPSSRYSSDRSDWMLEPASSGGGCTRNLAVHFIDLFLALTGLPGGEVSVVTAAMARDYAGGGVEDYSIIVIEGGGSTCSIETGYLFLPSSRRPTDISFSVRTSNSYLIAGPPVEGHRSGGGDVPIVDLEIATLPLYQRFIGDLFDRLASGQAPLADLGALVDAANLVDEAYEKASWTESGTEQG